MDRSSTDLLAAFTEACPEEVAPDESAEIAQALLQSWETARERYPGLQIEGSEFARFLAARVDDSPVTASSIRKRVTSDIYLACACVAGEPEALRLLDSQILATLPAAMARLKLGSGAIEEAVQRARTKLIVGREGEGKLRDFSGTGDLRGWVKVIAIRDALRSSRKVQREVSLSDELEAALPTAEMDPELAYQRRLYAAEFKASFEAAVDDLTPRERSLLRQSLVYGSTVDQVALVYQVHRATAARWIAKAREELANKTRTHLRKRLDLSESQFVSVVRLVESQMDLSMERLLATADGDEKLDKS